MNVQYAVKDGERLRDRGEPARLAHGALRLEGDRSAAREARRARDGPGKTLDELGFTEEIMCPSHFSVKEAVFPFVKFPGVDTLLGPEMKSTGEVMGIDSELRPRLR